MTKPVAAAPPLPPPPQCRDHSPEARRPLQGERPPCAPRAGTAPSQSPAGPPAADALPPQWALTGVARLLNLGVASGTATSEHVIKGVWYLASLGQDVGNEVLSRAGRYHSCVGNLEGFLHGIARALPTFQRAASEVSCGPPLLLSSPVRSDSVVSPGLALRAPSRSVARSDPHPTPPALIPREMIDEGISSPGLDAPSGREGSPLPPQTVSEGLVRLRQLGILDAAQWRNQQRQAKRLLERFPEHVALETLRRCQKYNGRVARLEPFLRGVAAKILSAELATPPASRGPRMDRKTEAPPRPPAGRGAGLELSPFIQGVSAPHALGGVGGLPADQWAPHMYATPSQPAWGYPGGYSYPHYPLPPPPAEAGAFM